MLPDGVAGRADDRVRLDAEQRRRHLAHGAGRLESAAIQALAAAARVRAPLPSADGTLPTWSSGGENNRTVGTGDAGRSREPCYDRAHRDRILAIASFAISPAGDLLALVVNAERRIAAIPRMRVHPAGQLSDPGAGATTGTEQMITPTFRP